MVSCSWCSHDIRFCRFCIEWSHCTYTVVRHRRSHGCLGRDFFEKGAVLRSVDFKFPALAVSINTESGDIIHMVVHKMKEFVDFNSRNSVKSQCMGKYSIINTINKKVLGHLTTCLQSKVWGWALWRTGGVYIHISSKLGMDILKIVGPSTAKYGISVYNSWQC